MNGAAAKPEQAGEVFRHKFFGWLEASGDDYRHLVGMVENHPGLARARKAQPAATVAP